MLKIYLAGILSWYFEEIELTLSLFTAEYCAMTSERWRYYPKSKAPHYICTHWNKLLVITVKEVTKIGLNTRFVV